MFSKIKRIPILSAAILLSFFSGDAQVSTGIPGDNYNYRVAVGLRAGRTQGLVLSKFEYSRGAACELIIGLLPGDFSVTGLYERYDPLAKGLDLFYGGGMHIASRTKKYYSSYNKEDYYYRRETIIGLGIDWIIGVEYKAGPIPFALKLELKPFVEVNPKGKTYLFLDPGLGLKYTF